MKRTFAFIIAALMVLSVIAVVPAAAETSGDWIYYVWENEETGDQYAIITGYIGSGVNVTVPATIAGFPVLGLEKGAFDNCDTVTSITVSEGIVAVWEGAINYCLNLESVYLPSSCLYISGESIKICSKLKSILVSDANTSFFSRDGVLYQNTSDTILIEYPSGKTNASFSVPNDVTRIDPNAFDCCFDLEKVTLPSGLTFIGEGAFQSCTGLEEVFIPSSVTTIEFAPFVLCHSLKSITVADGNDQFCSENGVLYTKDGSILIEFPAGSDLTSFVAPSSVKEIAPSAFEGSNNLVFVNVSSVSQIDYMAFWNCENLKEIVLSNVLEFVGAKAFDGCLSLNTVCYWGTSGDLAGLEIYDDNDPLLYASLYYLPIPGDVNVDLKINSKDVTALMKYIVGLKTPGFVAEAADFNGDGKVNSKDVIALMKYIVSK